MRILLLNEYFPPDTSATAKMAAAVVDALAERHEVVVLCGRPSYDPSERHPFYIWRRERRGQIAVERVGSTTFPRHRMLHRLLNYLSYVILAVPRALMIRADVVLAMTDPPFEGIVGAFVAWLKRKPLVYNIRDLYPEMAISGEIVRPARWVQVWEKMHRWALANAERVIVLGEDTRQRIIAKGVDPCRVVVVRDGARIPQSIPNRDHAVTREIRSGYRFVVLYAGNLGFYGAWETVVKAAQMLNGDGVGFVFVGDGAMRSQLEASARGCKAIHFLPYRPTDQVPHVLAAGDLHLVTIRRGLEGVVVPSKLYPILAAGRPVLVLAPETSDAAQLVRESGCGLVADPDDATSLAALVQQLARDPGRVAEMSDRAAALAPEFSLPKELRRFAQVLEDAVQ
ncbi:MAG TPA: glycosyltransferase family 4 protein [Terriglobia bacterium]|nr:glycosyltransferase family 4 protein [Terriglobia bacterium]